MYCKAMERRLLETSGSSLSPFSSPSFLNPGTFVVGICSVKPCSNISLHFHDNSSLSTSEGTCLYCKQTSLGNWPVFFLYLIFHLFKGFASKRSRLQVCTFSFLNPPLPFVSERGRSWRLKFSQLVTLTTSQSKAEYLCVPVFTCKPIFGAYQHIAWFHFSTSPSEIGS